MMNEQKLTMKPQKMKYKKSQELIMLQMTPTCFPDYVKTKHLRNGPNELHTRFQDGLASLIKYGLFERFIRVRNPAERFSI